jgi:hypothetical protein
MPRPPLAPRGEATRAGDLAGTRGVALTEAAATLTSRVGATEQPAGRSAARFSFRVDSALRAGSVVALAVPALFRVSYVELTHEPGRRERRVDGYLASDRPAARDSTTDRDGGPRCGRV